MRRRDAYDRWRDAVGIPITDGCQVVQVAVAKGHGALSSRLYRRAEVISRNRGRRLLVRFEGEGDLVSIQPQVLRVVQTAITLPPLERARIMAELERLRELLPTQGGRDGSR